MHKVFRHLFLCVFVAIVSVAFVACGEENEPVQPVIPPTETFSITFSVENDLYGSVSCKRANGTSVLSGEKFEKNTALTLTATANTGYTFDGWYKGTDKVGESAEYSFTMPESNLSLVAKFAINSYAFAYSSEDENKGTVNCDVASGTNVNYNTGVTLIATPNTGYTFDGWYDAAGKVSANAEYTFNMPDNAVTLQARFIVNSYRLTYSSEDENKGTVNCDIISGTDVNYNTSVTITATPNEGYSFVDWFDGEKAVSTNASYNFPMSNNAVTLQARFVINSYKLTYSSEDENKGTVGCAIASGTDVNYNTSVTITATPNTGYDFLDWYNGEISVSTDAEYIFNMPDHAVTLQARFKAQKRTVNFYVDADVIGTRQVDYNTAAPTGEIVASKDNNEFIGWFTDPEFKSVYGGEPITSNMDLYAKFNPIAIFYTVRFFDYDGSQIDNSQSIEQGSKAIIPANPSRSGYTFGGWTFNDAPLADDFIVERDMDVFATYTENEYTVTFYDELGEHMIDAQQIKHGKTVAKPTTPTKSGYVFSKWLLNGYEFDFETSVTETLNIYASWTEAVKPTFTVTFYDELGGNVIDIQTIEEGSDATAPQIPEKTGKVFKEWSDDFTNITANTEIYATYETATCEITFAYYDSTAQKDVEKKETVNYGTDATALAPAAVQVAKTGYTFNGWDKAFTNVTEDIKVTAVYTIKNFTATFRLGDDTHATETADYGATFKIPTTPDVAGYSFMGWFKDADFNVPFDFTAPATENVTVYGKLEEIIISTYTVKFVDFDNRTISEQTIVEHEAASAPGNPSRTGYTFKGWNKAFNDVTENLTVNAQYEINKYTVTYYEADGETLIDTKQAEYNSDASDLVTAPAVTGKYFLKWSKNLSTVTKDVSVYAIYANNIVTVKFIDADGTTELSRQSVEYGAHASVPSTPVKQGYIFKAWVVAAGSDETFDFNTVITAETEIFAKWEQASGVYSVYFKDYDGNSYGNVQRVVAGYYATEPGIAPAVTDPNREFDGWYVEGTENKFDFEHTQIFNTITLVAKDKAKTTD